MADAIDYGSPVGLVRLNITDTDADPDKRLLTDDQIQAWLDSAGGSVNRATYRALLTIAASTVLISKKIRTQDLSTDGPAEAAALRALAQEYKADADAEDGLDSFSGYVSPVPDRGREGEEFRW